MYFYVSLFLSSRSSPQPAKATLKKDRRHDLRNRTPGRHVEKRPPRQGPQPTRRWARWPPCRKAMSRRSKPAPSTCGFPVSWNWLGRLILNSCSCRARPSPPSSPSPGLTPGAPSLPTSPRAPLTAWRTTTMADVAVLDVLLHGTPVATLTRVGDDRIIFAFNEAYIADDDRPTLGLGFKDRLGELITDFRPTRTKALPFFSNLLPEGHLRTYLAERAGVNPEREFFLLRALGKDLPGAITIRPAGADAWPTAARRGSRTRPVSSGPCAALFACRRAAQVFGYPTRRKERFDDSSRRRRRFVDRQAAVARISGCPRERVRHDDPGPADRYAGAGPPTGRHRRHPQSARGPRQAGRTGAGHSAL